MSDSKRSTRKLTRTTNIQPDHFVERKLLLVYYNRIDNITWWCIVTGSITLNCFDDTNFSIRNLVVGLETSYDELRTFHMR